MRVLILGAVDTGGQGYRIAKAFERHAPDWTVDSIGDPGPLGYPQQQRLAFTQRQKEVRRLFAEADVVHMRNNLRGWNELDAGQGKPLILHHHGTQFRTNHGSIASIARQAGAVQIASTLDLTLLEPDVEWVPSPYNLEELAALRQAEYVPSDTIRIAHFPTSNIKSPAAFIAATDSLAKRYPIEVITNYSRGRMPFEPWPDVMRRKARADIYYDQCILGYGNNAVESWGLGTPVLAGVRDQGVRGAMLQRFGGTLPFMETTEDTIEVNLERLIVDVGLRKEYAKRGMDHVLRYHDEAVVVEQLKGIYAAAQPSRGTMLPRVMPRWSQRHRARVVA